MLSEWLVDFSMCMHMLRLGEWGGAVLVSANPNWTDSPCMHHKKVLQSCNKATFTGIQNQRVSLKPHIELEMCHSKAKSARFVFEPLCAKSLKITFITRLERSWSPNLICSSESGFKFTGLWPGVFIATSHFVCACVCMCVSVCACVSHTERERWLCGNRRGEN